MSGQQQVVVPISPLQRNILLNLDEQIIEAKRKLDQLNQLREEMLSALQQAGITSVDEIAGLGVRQDENSSSSTK